MKKTITKYGLSRHNQTFKFERRHDYAGNYLSISNTDDRDFFDTYEEAVKEKERLLVVYSKYEKHQAELEQLKQLEILEVQITLEVNPAQPVKA